MENFTKPQYDILRASSEEEEYPDFTASEKDELLNSDVSKPSKVKFDSRLWRLLLPISIVNIMLFTATVGLIFWKEISQPLNPLLRQVSTYSPIFDMVDLELHKVTINGTLYPTSNPSLARMPPSPEADVIWQEWELSRIIPITKAQVIALGKDPTSAAKLPDEDWHLGDDAYMASFDVFHQLHCLNKLRKIAHGEYYQKDLINATKRKELWYIHIDHCVDILMQALQCSGNVNLVTMHWVEDEPWPYPDMSVQRQCINFEKLVDFRKEVTIDMDRYVALDIVKPEGTPLLPAANSSSPL